MRGFPRRLNAFLVWLLLASVVLELTGTLTLPSLAFEARDALRAREAGIRIYTWDFPLGALLMVRLVELPWRVGRRGSGGVGLGLLGLAGLVVWGFVSAAYSPEPWVSLNGALLFFRVLIVWLYVRSAFVTGDLSATRMTRILLSLGGGLAAHGLLQQILGTEIGLWTNYFGERLVRPPDMALVRVRGPFFDPNLLAIWLVVTLALVIGRIGGATGRARGVGLIWAIPICVVIYLTGSRAGWVAVFAQMWFVARPAEDRERRSGRGAAAFGFMGRLGRAVGLTVIVVGAALATSGLFGLTGRSLAESWVGVESEFEVRFGGYYAATWAILREHGWFGVGLWRSTAEFAGLVFGAHHRSSVHNGFLLMAVETGVPGGVLFLVWWIAGIRDSWYCVRKWDALGVEDGVTKAELSREHDLVRGLYGAVLSLFFVAQVHLLIANSQALVLCGVVLGAAAGMRNRLWRRRDAALSRHIAPRMQREAAIGGVRQAPMFGRAGATTRVHE